MGSGAKSYMRKGFLIYEEMRKIFTICKMAVSHSYKTLRPIPLNFLKYEENFIFFFISVASSERQTTSLLFPVHFPFS
jgi:hypothetical protein